MEDPTPNLQRVREKLEVEMLLAQEWVVTAARQVGSRVLGFTPSLDLVSICVLPQVHQLSLS